MHESPEAGLLIKIEVSVLLGDIRGRLFIIALIFVR